MNHNKVLLSQLEVSIHLIRWDKKEFLRVLLKMKTNKSKNYKINWRIIVIIKSRNSIIHLIWRIILLMIINSRIILYLLHYKLQILRYNDKKLMFFIILFILIPFLN